MNCTRCKAHIDVDANYYASEECGDFCEECLDLRAYEGLCEAHLHYVRPVSELERIIDREGL